MAINSFLSFSLFFKTNVKNLLDSDMSSELILSKLLSEEGKILTTSWYYSTEIRIINTQLIFTPLFLILKDWHMIRVIGTTIIYLIYALCVWYFCKQAKLKKYFPIIMAILFLPVSSCYYSYNLLGAYYIPYICISMILLGILIQFSNSKKRILNIALIVIASVLSILAGMAGLRQILIFYIPAVFCGIITFFMQIEKPKILNQDESLQKCNIKNTKRTRFLFFSLWILFMALIGYIINNKILSNIYCFENLSETDPTLGTFETIKFVQFSFERVSTTLKGILSCLGYQTGEVFSIALFNNILAILIFILIIIAIFHMFRKTTKYLWEHRIITLFLLLGMICIMGVYTFTDIMHHERYYIPILVFAVPVIIIFIKNLEWKQSTKNILAIGLCYILTVVSFINYTSLSISGNFLKEKQEISKLLVQEGYTEGYATFWNCNVLTEYSNGYIEMRCVPLKKGITNFEINSIYKWLQVKEHETTTPKGKVFILVSFAEDYYFENIKKLDKNHIIYKGLLYIVYGYDSYEELQLDITT